jgi:hypothetical protein
VPARVGAALATVAGLVVGAATVADLAELEQAVAASTHETTIATAGTTPKSGVRNLIGPPRSNAAGA